MPVIQNPNKPKSGLLITIVITVIALVGGAGVGYYVSNTTDLGTSGGASIGDDFDNAPEELDDIEPGSLDEDEMDDYDVKFREIWTETPLPPWEDAEEGPEFMEGRTFSEADIYTFESPDEHLAFLYSGRINPHVVTFHPDRIENTIHGVLQEFSSNEYVRYANLHIADVNYTRTEVEGQKAVLGETTVTWWTSEDHQEAYANVAVLVIDAGGHDAMGGLVAVPEFENDHYQDAVDILLEAELS